MATYKCNSCNATYQDILRDGTLYFHACGPQPNPAYQPNPAAVNFDARQTLEHPNKRDENVPANLMYINGKPLIVTRDPNDATRQIQTPAAQLTIAEGAGRTQIAP